MKKLYCLLLVLLLSGLTWAIEEYGQLAGVVTDNQGAPLPGATITLESEAMIGGARTLLSNESGDFLFIQLRPGDYTVTCAMEGFQSVKNEMVKVHLDRMTKLIVKLQAAQEFQETVVVTGQAPVVDPTQTNIGDVYDEEYLQETAIGSSGRGYQDVMLQSGGTTGSAASGNPTVLGSTYAENNYLIDGLSTTDPVTSTFGTNFNFDAIQEISMQMGGFEAEYGQATGGIVNVVTKSGSNSFEGVFDIRYSDESFQEGSDKYPLWAPYDPSKDKTSEMNPALSLGGPILKDTVWFFVSVQQATAEYTPSGVSYGQDWNMDNYMAKITWQISPNDTLIGKWSTDPWTIKNVNASLSYEPEAARTQEQGGNINQLDYSRILSESLLLSAKLGINKQELNSFPTSGDLDTPAVYDNLYGVWSENYPSYQYNKRDRTEAQLSLTWFKNNILGDHTFKAGASYQDLMFNWEANITGDAYYLLDDWTGDGVVELMEMFKFSHDPWIKSKGKQTNFYLQDEWKILPNLVFKPGVRFDEVKYTNNAGMSVADLKLWQPRIGLAWDVFNSAKTVVRGYYGTFMHPNSLSLPDYLREGDAWQQEWGYIPWVMDDKGYTQDEVCMFYECEGDWAMLRQTDYATGSNTPVDPNIKATTATQFTVGIEHEIAPRTGIELTYVQKRTKYIMDDTCAGYDAEGNFIDPADYVDQPDTWADWGKDAGTADNPYCSGWIIRNPTGAGRYYYAYLFKFESRYKDWFHVMVDYTYSKMYEWSDELDFGAADYDAPWHYYNRYGYGNNDIRHYFKFNGFFHLPANFTVGFNSFFRTGRPYSKYVDMYGWRGEDSLPVPEWGGMYLERKGNYRLNSVWNVDLQASWDFKFTEGIRGKIIASINNVTNNEAILGRCSYWNSTDPNEAGAGEGACGGYYNQTTEDPTDVYWLNWGEPYGWQAPRSYEVGFRIEF
jgi:hypothetical protein